MHPSVDHWIGAQVGRHGLGVPAPILEIGSYNVNGTIRKHFRSATSYVGLDARPGPGVDVVADVESYHSIERLDLLDAFAVVVCTEMLEHTPRPWRAVVNMAGCLVRGGRLLLTTRAPGFGLHDHPCDYYRFTRPAIEILLGDAGLDEIETFDDPEYPGVFATGISCA